MADDHDPMKEYNLDSSYMGYRDFYQGTGEEDQSFRGIQPGSIWHDREFYSRERDFGRGGQPYGWESFNPPSDSDTRRRLRPSYRTSFQPPDDVILKQIKDRVRDVPELDACDDLSIDVNEGVVTFSGFVDNQFAKNVAYNVAKVHGVRQIWNDLVVRKW